LKIENFLPFPLIIQALPLANEGKKHFCQCLRQRTEKPFAFEFRFRLTVAFPEFRLRFHADVPLWEDDQKLAFELRLAKEPPVSRLPASAVIIIKLFTHCASAKDKRSFTEKTSIPRLKFV